MSAKPSNRLAGLIVRLAARLLPPSMRAWGAGMASEVAAIDRPLEALSFALGCLGFAAREAVLFPLLRPFRAPAAAANDQFSDHGGPAVLHFLRQHPRGLAALCAVVATTLGLAYLALAGAPILYLIGNVFALTAGFLTLGMLTMGGPADARFLGLTSLGLAGLLVATSLLGVEIEGARRWIMLGGIAMQPSLIILPPLVMIFARTQTALAACGVAIAAIAMALQPDRAMAASLAVAAAALLLMRPSPMTALPFITAAAGFVVTLARPDNLPAVPFVDRVFYTAFEAHPLASLAVLTGAVVMMAPFVVGWFSDAANRPIHAAFGAVWLTIILAAALGNYPTPLVGYGASAIIGYVLSLLGLPRRLGSAQATASAPAPQAVAARNDESRIGALLPG